MHVPSETSLYLQFTAGREAADDLCSLLIAALDAAPIASLLIGTQSETALDPASTRSLVELAQKRGVAVLLSDAGLAANVSADGVHVSWSTDIVRQFKTTRAAAGGMIVGADAGRTRHDAMELGESGADYVAFGIPAHVEDRQRAAERQLDLVSWWSEVFEIPCVALDVATVEQAGQLAKAGADFVGVAINGNEPAAEAAARVRAYSQAIAAYEDVK
jgi:thiamine-phosphate pyrophosphorylase